MRLRMPNVLFLLWIASCSLDHPTAPVLVISDGAHAQGTPNPDFFFLQPTVPAPAHSGNWSSPPGGFDSSLSPIVEVCALDVGNVSESVITPSTPCRAAGYALLTPVGLHIYPDSTSADPGIALTGTDDDKSHYHTSWNIPSSAADVFYRLRVRVNSLVLGYADVHSTRSGAEQGGVNSTKFIGKPDGFLLKILFRIEKGALWPLVAPDTTPAWFAHDSSVTAGGELKGVLFVRFFPDSSPASKRAAVDSVGGLLLGGSVWREGDPGFFYIGVSTARTFVALDSVKTILERQPSVKWAIKSTRVVTLARRPKDGIGWQQADWKLFPDSSQGPNWALEEIAAPTAWGCEVGDTSVHIGIIDWSFTPDDFSPNVVGNIPARGAGDTATIKHGTATANILAARGNNSHGMSGAMWHASLHLRAVGIAAGGEVISPALYSVVQASGAQIVSISLGARFKDTLSQARILGKEYAAAIQEGMDFIASVGLTLPLVVIAAGNNADSAQFSGYTGLKNAYPHNVIVVGASTQVSGGTRDRWGGSSFARGSESGSNYGPLVDLYAPGASVKIWNDSTAGADKFSTFSGTSFSAPMVAGVAGLLKAFNPALTASQIKDLIIDGADAGQRTLVSVPGKVLNAYESLKLAAHASGTPICGFPVSVTDSQVRLERPGNPETFQVPSGQTAYGLSVAQGGRQLVVWSADLNGNGLVQPYKLISQSWAAQSALSTLEKRWYLEQDTVDLIGSSRAFRIRHGDGTPADSLNIFALPTGFEPFQRGSIEFSPDGKYAALGADYRDVPCTEGTHGSYTVELPSGPSTSVFVGKNGMCSPLYGVVTSYDGAKTWTATGGRVIHTVNQQVVNLDQNGSPQITAESFLLADDSISAGTHAITTTTVANKNAYLTTWRLSDWRLHLFEQDINNSCQSVTRAGTSPFGIVSSPPGCDYLMPYYPNLRAAIVASSIRFSGDSLYGNANGLRVEEKRRLLRQGVRRTVVAN